MKIENYEYKGVLDNWNFVLPPLKKINLMVGNSGTGKTKCLNTIFNLGRSAVININEKGLETVGNWKINFSLDKYKYEWHFISKVTSDNRIVVEKEKLCKTSNPKKTIVERNDKIFKFNKNKLPKLPQNISSIALLKDENSIKPIYNAFASMMKRSFQSDLLVNRYKIQYLMRKKNSREKILDILFRNNPEITIHIKLKILKEEFPEKYKLIKNYFLETFDFVEDIVIKDATEIPKLINPELFPSAPMPVICIKERNVKDLYIASEMASGMQKVLLLITDIVLLPEGGIFLIDEYENSLGLNAIDFFPNFLKNNNFDHQYFLTSHHPYIINNIPIENWLVLHRLGDCVTIKSGDELKDKYGKSRQQHFTQLINDPFYRDGIE